MICFDVTIRGYSALCEADQGHIADQLGLVKWVLAPNREALNQFIGRHQLASHLDADPYDMGPGTEQYTHMDGVDVILGSSGEIISQSEHHEPVSNWLSSVGQAAEALQAVTFGANL